MHKDYFRARALWSLLLLGTASLPGCGGDTVTKSETIRPRIAGEQRVFDSEAGWLQGDTHVHSYESTDSHARSTPELIKATGIERGLEWVLLTDHSNATGSRIHCLDAEVPNDCVENESLHNLGPEFPQRATAAALSDSRFVMVDGNEASPVDFSSLSARGHVNILPRDPATFDADWIVVDRPGGVVSGGAAVTSAHAHDALAIVNHPYSPQGIVTWTEYDWTNMDYDAMEVYNASGGYDEGDRAALDAALCDYSQGRPVALVGASDNHRTWVPAPGDILNPGLGAARTSVFVPRLDWSEVVAAVEQRHTIAHDADTFLDLRVRVDGLVLMPGDVRTVAEDVVVRIEIGAWTATPADAVIVTVQDGQCVDRRQEPLGESGRVEIPKVEIARFPITAAPAANGVGGQRHAVTATLKPGTTVAAFFVRDWKSIAIGDLDWGQAIPSPIRLSPK